ncbi:GNAT family N-acetyltransferase [Mycobacterium koreense]|nr:GNAT family N-acetyltransferase [Mycolicibacillus koreensis]MCV7248767.1 GNAT family N-acetyltransferase [Mycolicibacillus koreensis]BBY55733.1 GCN5-like N-acetyltransferase [Mycolicibacillus koreensis]
MPIDVRAAQKTDLPAIARVLGRAFYDDPVSMWLIPDDDKRSARLPRMFGTLARYHHLAGGGSEVASDDGTVGAVALWDPPNRWKPSRRAQLLAVPALIAAFGSRLGAGRVLEETLRARHPEEPHWYLATIGSDPLARGRGLGAQLMRSRLDRCDAERCPAYLESSKAENVPYYQRFGFEVTGEVKVPDGGPTLWTMWRLPR